MWGYGNHGECAQEVQDFFAREGAKVLFFFGKEYKDLSNSSIPIA